MKDVILDTDTYNEIDDQFALCYLLKLNAKLNTVAVYAAPFLNDRSISAKDGMEKSYAEIIKLLGLIGRLSFSKNVYKGSVNFLKDENTPVISDAALDLVNRAKEHSPQNKLNVVCIGAITNIASAILIDSTIINNVKVIWLGGHERTYVHNKEFNLRQDIAAARVVMGSGVEFVQLPAEKVVSQFTYSKFEFEEMLGKNKTLDYLVGETIKYCTKNGETDFNKVIWDVVAIGYMLNEDEKFMTEAESEVYLPNYFGGYEAIPINNKIKIITKINVENLKKDLCEKLS